VQVITGKLKFQANVKFSYDVEVYCKVSMGGGEDEKGIETRNTVFMQDQNYHYLSNPNSAVDAQGYGHAVGNDVQVTAENGYHL